MSRNPKWREEFIHQAAGEGLPLDVARKVLRYAATLHRLAELECSSEAADRDRVACPGYYAKGCCLCRDYGSGVYEGTEHGDVPRIAVKEARTQQLVSDLLTPYPLKAYFAGDPRGCVLTLVRADVKREDFESGRACGIGVPS